MKPDMMISKRIMMQIIQTGHFISETPEEAYHVALLADKLYVVAKIEMDEFGTPIKATVGRLTAAGHAVYETEFASQTTSPSTPNFCETYYKILVDNKHSNETARDKMLATIATGGIGLLFAIASYLKTNGKAFPLSLWFLTLALWACVLIGLLLSDHLGGKAIDAAISQLANQAADVMHHYTAWDKVSKWINRVNCIFAIVGIFVFALFLKDIS